ncbi:MAG TPA: prepilin-type N-terminal cleavage/methylation domain-containing protein [Candidatus Avamphibacillus intestinigallinarum]|nr:prepilin-type N-terminal cleavage/methylation domain-containing protein [Candidatus Avamphibacillus intestinigallinarum]
MLKKEDAFTLIEMLIVLLIISVLIILIIPNLSGKSKEVHNKGCKALQSLVQAQADSYHLDHGQAASSIQALIDSGYIESDQKTCPNQKTLSLQNGKVIVGSGS